MQANQSAICNLQSAICNPFVSDFGLARRLEADSGLTPTGIALGTPSYMAPEQALPKGGGRRPQPTIAADIYSLGAILYEMLAGRAPFRAETPLQTLLEALHTEAPRPRTLVPEVPVELETVCLKCLDKDPARRYPTAAALAEDLERFLAGEPVQARPLGPLARWWRWCRRHPVPAALTGALAVSVFAGLAVSTWQWSRAERHYREALDHLDRANRESERAEAHAREADAGFDLAHRSVIRFFNRFSEQPAFRETPAFRAVRREMLLEARDYFEQFLARRDDPVLRAELAATYNRIAAIDDEVGSRSEALAHFRRARALFEQAAEVAPANRAIRIDLARTIHRLALLEAAAAATTDALRDYELARDRFTELLRGKPGDAEILGDLAAVLNNLGGLYRKLGRPGDARACFEEKIGRSQELTRLRPADPAAAVTLAAGWLALGRLDASEGREAERDCCDLVAREVLEQQWERTPRNTGVRRELSALYRHLGGRLGQDRRYPEAVELLNRSVALLQKLTDEDREFIGYQVDLGLSLRQLGHTLRDAGRPDAALAPYRRAVALAEGVLARDPDTPGHRADLASAHFDVGTALAAKRQWAEAEQCFARAVEHCRAVPRPVQQEPGRQYSLGLALKNLAAMRWNLGNHVPARESVGEAVEAFRAAVDGAPRSAEYQRSLADCLGTVVTFELADGRPQAALVAARERLRDAGKDPGLLYAAARDLARVAGAKATDTPDDQVTRRNSAELATRALRQALERGFADAERLRRDDVFKELRDRPDFPRLPSGPPPAP